MFLPYITGDWSSDNMTWEIGASGGLALALVWLYFMCWSSYGIEIVASFAPEYQDTERDTARALRAAALFSGVVYVLLPLGVGGTLGTTVDLRGRAHCIAFYSQAFDAIVGSGLANVMIFCVVAASDPVDEHRDDGRLASAVRHRQGRDDDQAVRRAQPVQRARHAR